jgi:signal peptidase I
MEAPFTRPRRAWLAALLSLLGCPLGQVYAGRFRRSVLLWVLGVLLLPLFAFSLISLPVGRRGFLLLLACMLACMLAFPIYLAVDAFLLARRNRDAPLKRYQRWWIYVLVYAAFCTANSAVAYGVRSFIGEAFVIPTRAMSPTIQPGDRILVDKLWCSPKSLRRNDVVVFRSEGPDSPLYVKRLVALPGDVVEVKDEQVFLNGEKWEDPHAVIDSRLPPFLILSITGPSRFLPTRSSYWATIDGCPRTAESPAPFRYRICTGKPA